MPKPTREPPKRSAKSYAVWLLSRREYAARELLDKLTTRGYPPEEAAAAVAEMQRHGFQDDQRFAAGAARTSAQRMGNRSVSAKLAAKGISRDMASEQLEQLEPEETRAMRVAARFEGKPFDDSLKAKAYRYLASRGFSGGAVKVAMRHLQADARRRAEEGESAVEEGS
jgi:regulatory protein